MRIKEFCVSMNEIFCLRLRKTILVRMAIVNGMFENCDSVCLYDFYQPSTRSYKWNELTKCWAQDFSCIQINQRELEYALKFKEELCTSNYNSFDLN